MADCVRPLAAGEFTRLGRDESLRLLAGVPVGRLIFTVGALPTVRVVNFALAGGLVVVRTAADSAIAGKAAGAVVAFEADDLDPVACSGWSVVVTGHAALVTDPGQVAAYRALPLAPWAAGTRDRFVVVATELVEGRRVRRPPATAGVPGTV